MEPANLKQLAQNALKSVGEYLASDIDATTNDYDLLEKMNRLAMDKYNEMQKNAALLKSEMQTLESKNTDLTKSLASIDALEATVSRFEAAAQSLDSYSKRLEARFKQLEKADRT